MFDQLPIAAERRLCPDTIVGSPLDAGMRQSRTFFVVDEPALSTLGGPAPRRWSRVRDCHNPWESSKIPNARKYTHPSSDQLGTSAAMS